MTIQCIGCNTKLSYFDEWELQIILFGRYLVIWIGAIIPDISGIFWVMLVDKAHSFGRASQKLQVERQTQQEQLKRPW